MLKEFMSSVVVGLCLSVSVQAQPDSLWSRTYNGRDWDESPRLIQLPDSGYMIAGMTGCNDGGHPGGIAIRTDRLGNILWQREYDNIQKFIAIFPRFDNKIQLIGYSSNDKMKACLLLIDSNGEILENHILDTQCKDATQLRDGGFALTGGVRIETPISNTDADTKNKLRVHINVQFTLEKTDHDGNTQWKRVYGSEEREECSLLIQTIDDGFALVGTTGLVNHRILLIKTDENGDSLWSKTYGVDGNGINDCEAFIQTSDSGFVLLGTTNPSTLVSKGKILLIRTDSRGNVLWTRQYGDGGHNEGADILLMRNGDFVLAGTSSNQSNKSYSRAITLIRTTPKGEERWSKIYNQKGHNSASMVLQTNDKGFALIGDTDEGVEGIDFMLIKTEPDTTSE